jgi:hypothetical protein
MAQKAIDIVGASKESFAKAAENAVLHTWRWWVPPAQARPRRCAF